MEPLSANDPRMIGEFRLHAQLGAGGMGQVYLGFSPAGHAVAIKVIHPQFARDQEFLRRFSHEVAAASAVGGMYTAPVVDYDLTSGAPWLATAYVPGPTLGAFIGKHGPLPEAALWRLAAGLAEALRAVHAKGLVHRDLKPGNVLLADNGPHVIDFGISRATSSVTQLTSVGMAIGTPGYMSPEQVQAQQAGPPSDMFSLGCVLAYAATGAPPFGGDSPASILYRIVTAAPDLGTVPPGLRQVIEACLHKDPAKRPTPGGLIAMIGQLGPATPASLGSFWPDAVARAIAAEQAAQTPTGLTPPAPFAATSTVHTTGAGGPSRAAATPALTEVPRPAGRTSPAPAVMSPEHQPAALAAPPATQGAGATGHAPMIADGYYAAARHPSSPVPQPGGGNAIPPYAPGRRKPMSAEVPPAVRNAIWLMYAGFAMTVVALVFSMTAMGRYDYGEGLYLRLGKAAAAASEKSMSGAMAVAIVAGFLGLACWIWLATATRRGHGWPRTAGAVLLGIDTIVTLFVVFGTKRDPGAELFTIIVWALGVAALILLWTQQAREFFFAWRNR